MSLTDREGFRKQMEWLDLCFITWWVSMKGSFVNKLRTKHSQMLPQSVFRKCPLCNVEISGSNYHSFLVQQLKPFLASRGTNQAIAGNRRNKKERESMRRKIWKRKCPIHHRLKGNSAPRRQVCVNDILSWKGRRRLCAMVEKGKSKIKRKEKVKRTRKAREKKKEKERIWQDKKTNTCLFSLSRFFFSCFLHRN